MNDSKVNLFLVGAMKAGTTKLVDVLKSCPEIYIPPIKEPNYFVTSPPPILYGPSNYFDLDRYFRSKFPEPKHIANLQKSEHYKQLYSLAKGQKYLLDASTMYLHAPDVAAKIYAYNPQAKIIILTRDPLERTYSHYRMLVGLNREIRSFEKVMDTEIQQLASGELPWYSCINMSMYQRSINEYTSRFKHVYILDFEDWLKDKNGRKISSLFHFLELENTSNSSVSEEIINPTRTLRFPHLFYILNKLGVKEMFSKLVPSTFKVKLFNLMSSKKKPSMVISKPIRVQLESLFKTQTL